LLGWDPYDVVGIDFHTVPVEPLLDKMGIPYEREKSCQVQTMPEEERGR
jgi:heterodisulfide reductase subunit B